MDSLLLPCTVLLVCPSLQVSLMNDIAQSFKSTLNQTIHFCRLLQTSRGLFVIAFSKTYGNRMKSAIFSVEFAE